ncbi:MAG TPA: AbrB/MazE/SpoVT family DNA-binding domain-containing protein [Tepidisphaeraceae bacterium]|nr:AbrB/MazE/SpoVT family DNA-binding domain-containing protein [Tepidisphaeraceae bacterium]
MIRTLTRQGNSLALVIDRSLRELLEIEADTPLKLTVQGRRLILEPITDPTRQERFRRAVEKVDRQHGRAMKKLAEQ